MRRTMIVCTALAIAPPTVAMAQNYYQHYGTSLGRIKGYGTLETDNYRGTTNLYKRSPASSYFNRKVHTHRYNSRSRPGRHYSSGSYHCYGRDCNGD